jgi:hypothetical protein
VPLEKWALPSTPKQQWYTSHNSQYYSLAKRAVTVQESVTLRLEAKARQYTRFRLIIVAKASPDKPRLTAYTFDLPKTAPLQNEARPSTGISSNCLGRRKKTALLELFSTRGQCLPRKMATTVHIPQKSTRSRTLSRLGRSEFLCSSKAL